ncbi:MAG: hypothetical protein R6V01_03220 [Thermoplasmatota archaeon]
MNETEGPDILSEEGSRKRRFEIPMSAAAASFAIMFAAALFIGGVLPGFLTGEEAAEEGDIKDRKMDILLSSTLDTVHTDEGTYQNVPLPITFELLFSEGFDEEHIKVIDAQLFDLIEFVFNVPSSFGFHSRTGQGWGEGAGEYEKQWGNMTGEPLTLTREVSVGADRTIFISLEIQAEGSE